MSTEIGNRGRYEQCIIVGEMQSSQILISEYDGLKSFIHRRGEVVNFFSYLPISLSSMPLSRWAWTFAWSKPSMDSLDITCCWPVISVSFVRWVRYWAISNKLSQVSPLDQISYLLFQLEAIFSVVSMILMELIILVFIPPKEFSLDLPGLLHKVFLIFMSTWAIGALRGGKIMLGRWEGVRRRRSLILLLASRSDLLLFSSLL